MSDQPNAGAISETAQTWKTIHIKHTLSHPNKANMEWWLRRPNDIRGPWVGLKFPDICLTSEEKPHPGNLSRPGFEPGPAAWQARMLPLAPQRWTDLIWKFKIQQNSTPVYAALSNVTGKLCRQLNYRCCLCYHSITVTHASSSCKQQMAVFIFRSELNENVEIMTNWVYVMIRELIRKKANELLIWKSCIFVVS